MKVLVGILKFLGAFFVLVGSLVSLLQEKLGNLTAILQVSIAALFFGFYIYYLVKTGTWNLRKAIYKWNVLVLIGLIIHLVLIVLCIYHAIRHPKDQFLPTIMLVIPFMLLTGLFDVNQFYKLWQVRKSVSGLTE